jgi:hypothetical protein
MKHFDDHRAAQAWYTTDTQGRPNALISYSTTVAEVTADRWLYINGLYSMTTRKHLGWFMRLLGLTYQDAKDLYNRGWKLNLDTGEALPIAE